MKQSNPDMEHDAAEHVANIPHSKAIGMKYISHTEDECTLAIRYAEHLIGDPDTGVIHGGAITALLDNAAGLIARPRHMHRDVAAIATLDMRIDYMGSAKPAVDVYAHAECFKRTQDLAFVRAVAYQEDRHDPIATCTATFMLGTRNKPFRSQDKAAERAKT
ncbi:MAG: PaaI family thioesterase [Pseudomonadota bacterium]